jgi:1-acyl-sn-glycerol-3-phosphate acyltransferase
VPISIIGAGEIMPRRSLRIKPGKITMVIDKPIDISGYSIENRQELIDRVQNIIAKNYDPRSVTQAA